MATVKFSNQDQLKKLQARILLEADISLTQQELLELSINMVSENFDLFLEHLKRGRKMVEESEINKLIALSTDWGAGTEDSSNTVDEYIYK